ncbi:MAG: hypothetical protein ACLQU3_12315 [Limisphaerales bacterium]
MKDAELNEVLKRATVPEREADYWERFPGRVMAELERRGQVAPAPAKTHASSALAWTGALRMLLSRSALAAGVAVVCLGLAFFLGFRRGQRSLSDDSQLAAARKYYHEIEALFPNQVQAIVFDQRGTRLVLAQEPNVPASPPLYLKVCGPKGCQRFVTFSGQQIRISGDVCDVLADGRGEVLIVGRQLVWSGTEAVAEGGSYQVEARALENHL